MNTFFSSFDLHLYFNPYLINFLAKFSLVLILGLLIHFCLLMAAPQASTVFRKSYRQWLCLLLFFITALMLGPFFGLIYSAIGLFIIILFALNEQSKRLYLRPWIHKRLQEYSFLCLLWAYFFPNQLLWFAPFIFWFGSGQLLWRMKVSSFREDIGLLIWMTQWIILPGGLLLAISNLENGDFKLNTYMLGLAVSSTFGKTGLAIYDKKFPHKAIYGEFAKRHNHLLRWFIGLLIHIFGASLIFISFNYFLLFNLHESLLLSALVGLGASLSSSLTRVYIYLTALDDNLMRRDQPMPILEVLTPFLMTNWIAYPYFLYLS